jgi:Uma2 family endonuclease
VSVITADEYLRIERAAEWKSEYIDGEMFAMAGASPRHVFIVANLVREIGNRLRESPCIVASADLRVATDRQRHYTSLMLSWSAIRSNSWTNNATQ